MMSMLRRCIAVSWGMTARVNGSRAGGGPAPCARGGCLLPLVPGQRVLDVFQPLPARLDAAAQQHQRRCRSEEHTSELQSLMRISYAVFCLKKKKKHPY